MGKPFNENFYKRSGVFGVAFSMVEVFMRMQSESALSASWTLLGHENVIRINDEGNFGLDSIKELPRMKSIAEKRAEKEMGKLLPIFFNEVVDEPFVPFKSV